MVRPAPPFAPWLAPALFALALPFLTLALPPAAALEPGLDAEAIGVRTFAAGGAEGLASAALTDIVQTPDGLLWLASHDGLLRFDGRRFAAYSRVRFPAMIDDAVNAIALDPEGYLFLGTERSGLIRFTGQAFWAVSRPDLGNEPWRVDHLVLAEDGNLWVGDGGQLWRLARGGNSVKPALPGVAVHDLQLDHRATLWIATNKGLFRRQGSALLPLSMPFGVRADNAGTVALDRQDDLWVGMLPQGLMRLRGELGRGGLPQEIVNETALDGRRIHAMLVDRAGTLWLGTDRGLYRRRVGAFEAIAAAGAEARSLFEDRDGSLWVGGVGELRQLYAPNAKPAPAAPLLARAEVDGKEVLLLHQVELEPGRHPLRLELTAATLYPGQAPRFRYRFEGLDDDWVESADGVVAVELPSGRRLFRAQASLGAAAWHPEELAITFNAPRPAWQNPILWLAGLAALAVLIVAGRWTYTFFRPPPEDDDD